MGVFKELGIVEASTLSNFIAQKSGITKDRLHKVSVDNATCPIKNDALKEISDTLNRMLSIMSQLEDTGENIKGRFDKAKQIIEKIQIDKNKIGVRADIPHSIHRLI